MMQTSLSRGSRLALVLALGAAALGGCKQLGGGVEGNGRVLAETRTLPPFKKVRATAGLHVRVEVGAQAVHVRGEENLVPLVETKVEGDTLIIGRKEALKPKLPLIIEVKAPAFEKLHGSSGATLWSSVRQPKLAVSCSSGATCDAAGEIDTLVLQASSGATLRAGGAVTQHAQVEASSGASLSVRAITSAKGRASSGAKVEILGTPKERAIESSSGASVTWK